jgi:hypothetical protein
MLESLTPPTDNLYKFIAISGLAIALFFGWSRVKIEMETWNLEKDGSSLLSTREELLKELFASGFHNLADEVEKGEIKNVDDTMARAEEILSSSSPKIEANFQELVENTWKRGNYDREHSVEKSTFFCFALVGLGISVFGFWLWWIRIQKFTDELLQLQLAKARKDLDPKS